jgi:DNA-binding SARP family transcriptional activator/tetratricopeptide (TPR) repeat protein
MNGDSGASRVQLLGVVRAWRGEQELQLGGPRRRAVLAMLALRAGQAVSRAEIIDGMWGGDPPDSAVNSVHVHVAALRRILEPRRERGAPGQVLAASGPGYLLRLADGQLDTAELDQHLARARRSAAAADLASAARSLDTALMLWHGTALSGIPGPWADIERVRLGELQLAVTEERIELMLALGGHHQVVAQLSGLIREHPLRERLREQLMVALYRCGRQADALAEFAAARHVLDSELGIGPGPAMRRLQQQILHADAALDLPTAPGSLLADPEGAGRKAGTGPEAGTGRAAGPSGRRIAAPVPRELPADVQAFTGRAAELAELDQLIAGDGQPKAGAAPASVVISAVAGTAGVGKTTLAVHWAHRARARFPDGQLYVDLRGYDPGDPMTPADALGSFMRALGVAAQDIPDDLNERASRYRSLLDGRRMLVVLDNAVAVEQVRPLLPGTPSCVVVVTSRDSLTGLVARNGARRLDLDLLPLSDAVALLRTLIGARVDADPGSAAALAEQCARLPLALRVAAEFAAARPDLPLAQLAGEMAQEQRRLDLLQAGDDPRTGVRGVFSWSYRHLPADAARAFRLIGLHPGPDLDVYAAAALTNSTLDRSRDLLDLLARASLIHPARVGRYGMHDLLRTYASQLAAQDADDERAALTRLFDYYLAAAGTAIGILVSGERRSQRGAGEPATLVPPLAGQAAARGWLDSERAALTAAAYRATRGWPRHAADLVGIVWRHIESGGHYTDAMSANTRALEAARRAGDRAAEAYALNALGIIERLGSDRQAVAYLRQALALFREIGDQFGTACTLTIMGSCDWRQGRYRQAATHRRQALALFREAGDAPGEAGALLGLGQAEAQQGHYPAAADHFRQAHALCTELGDQFGKAHALGNLAMIDGQLGRYPEAAARLQQALVLFREIKDRNGTAGVLTDLGRLACRLGRYPEAARHHRQALALVRETGKRSGEAQPLNGLGEVLLAIGEPGEARAQHAAAAALASQFGNKHEQARACNGLGAALLAAGAPDQARAEHAAALSLAGQSGDRPEQARAYAGLAASYQASGDAGLAREHWRRALADYNRLGLPEARDADSWMTQAAAR